MNTNEHKKASEALDRYLRGEMDRAHPDLPSTEAELAGSLRATASRINPDPKFTADLQERLLRSQTERRASRLNLGRLWPTLAGAGGMTLLALVAIWIIRSVAPQPITPAVQATGTPEIVFEASTPSPANTPTGPTYSSTYFPGETYSMQAEFPEAPAQVTLYQQATSQDNVSIETARAIAEKFGVAGSIYLTTNGPANRAGFMTTDGQQRVFVYGDQQFIYYVNPTWIYTQQKINPQEAIRLAEAFLQPRGLLDFPYQAKVLGETGGAVSFIPTLDGIPVTYPYNSFPSINVLLNEEGQVMQVDGSLPTFEALGTYPIISAQQAWDKLLTGSNPLGVQSDSWGYTPSNLKRWQRAYPLDEPITYYGSVETFQSAEGGEPFMAVGGYAVTGNIQGLETVSQGNLVQVDGQLFIEDGIQKLQVDAWQPSQPMDFIQGSLEQRDGQTWLASMDGRQLQVNKVPPDVPQGETLSLTGIILDDTLDWYQIDQGVGGGGGGGGGGPSLAKLNLGGTPAPTATAEVFPTPFDTSTLVGQTVEGLQGNLNVTYYQTESGEIRPEYILTSTTDENLAVATLQSKNPKELDAHHLLPIKVWGQVTGIDAREITIITVERFELVHPGLEVRAYIGKEEAATVDGQEVLLFVTQDGTSYVLRNSIEYGAEPNRAGMPGDQVIIEGWAIPGETFGGYPILDMTSVIVDNERTSLNGYILTSAQPAVIPESAILNMNPGQSAAVIDKVELVYYTNDLRYGIELPEGQTSYAQPVWRFSGHYGEYSFFEIYIQALPDEYLAPEPADILPPG